MPDKPWNCFSLLQAERTVDLACIGDAQTEFWFMGLQRCIFQCRTDMTVASWPQFIIKRCQMKMKLNLYGGMGKSRRAAAGRAELLANFFGGAVWGVFRENANCGDPPG